MRDAILEGRMAGIVNQPQGCVPPPGLGKAVCGKWGTDHIMTPLNDAGWQMLYDANIGQDVIWRQKAVIEKIVRFQSRHAERCAATDPAHPGPQG